MTSNMENCDELISDEEEQLIIQFRKNIQKQIPDLFQLRRDEDQNLYLLRWLRARDYNILHATISLTNHLKWRKERNVEFVAGKMVHHFFQENYPYRFPGVGWKGHPIILIPLSQWCFRKLLNNPERLVEFDNFVIKFYETVLSKLRTQNLLRKGTGKPPVTQVIFIMDVRDYPYSQLIKLEAIKKILHMMSMYESHYPEILYRAVFINCPTFFVGLFANMLKPILSGRTRKKIQFYSFLQLAKWKENMVELVDPSILPAQYGGTLKE